MNAKSGTRRGLVLHAWLIAAVCSLVTAPAVAQEQDRVEVTDAGTVTLTVKDTDLAQVLEMLSIQSRKNIITSKSVSATISANLYDVTFYEALDAILRVNGYGYLEEGNFIYVYTGPELEEIQISRRATQSRSYKLEYLAAGDAFEFITPLLSEAGQASFRGDVAPGFKPDLSDGGADSYAWAPVLVVNDYAENLDEIGELLEELDTAPTQVLIEATVLQTVVDEANAFGVDFSLIGSLDFTDLTDPLSPVQDLVTGEFQPADNTGRGVQQTVGNTAGPGGFKLGIIDEDFSVFLRLLDEVTDTTVLSRPKILCLNRQRAEVLVGERVGYLSTTATETTTTQTVEFLDTGIQLVVRPFVSEAGMVRMEIAPSVSEASLRTVTDANGLIVTIPDELTNEVTTNVRVPEGETLVLGGLFKETNSYTRRQTPILGDIPILGYAFRGQDDTVDRTEIIFLITPSIIEDELLSNFGEDAMAYAEEAQIGSRQGLLPYSRERMVDYFNTEAVKAFNEGDPEKALWNTNTSLRLKPSQPNMIRFRHQITGAEDDVYEKSLMERAIRKQLGVLFEDDKWQAVTPIEKETTVPSMLSSRFTRSNMHGMTNNNFNNGNFNGNDNGSPMANSTPAVNDPFPAPLQTPSPEAAPMSNDEQAFYDELFKSFFENLDAPAATVDSSMEPAVDASEEMEEDEESIDEDMVVEAQEDTPQP